MEQYDDEQIPNLLELQNNLKTNPEKLTLQYMRQTRRRLHSLVLQLDYVLNSKAGINKLIPDILYEIFILVVYDSFCPGRAVLKISHVCRHWRKSALEWPALWGVIDLNKHPSFFDLMMKRSQNSSLSLLWRRDWRGFDNAPSIPYFVSRAKFILPRLCSLVIYAPYSNFAQLHRIIQESISLPMQLQHLDIHLFRDPPRLNDNEDRPVPLPLTHLIDNSCLQKMILSGLDLPLFELPQSNLTHLACLKPVNVPSLPQLLVFLSNCPSLKTLELDFLDHSDRDGIHTTFATSTSPPPMNELVLKLTALKLRAWGPSSYKLIHQLSRCIRISPGALSQLICYFEWSGLNLSQQQIGPPLQIFGMVPPGTSPNFSNCRYLDISFLESPEKSFGIFGHTSASDIVHESGYPLSIMYRDFQSLDYSPILELAYAMPQICHLSLRYKAWVVLTLWPNPPICSPFPCLHTLELTGCAVHTLDFLPATQSLQFKRFILGSCDVSGDVIFDMVSRRGVEVLELIGCQEFSADEYSRVDVVSALREMGVDIVVREKAEE